MKPLYMLDTKICIYLMKHQPPQVQERFAQCHVAGCPPWCSPPAQVQERFAQCHVGDVVISSITLAELAYGVARSGESRMHNQAMLDSLLEDIVAVPFDHQAAFAYGPLRAQHPHRNRNALDKLIAAHALALGVTLVTNNEADFRSFSGLRIENWVEPH